MGFLSQTSFRRGLLTFAAGCMLTIAAVLLASAPNASATSVASVAKRLAADTRRLDKTRHELRDTRDELHDVRREYRVLRRQIEARLVAIYKSGGAPESLTSVVSGSSVHEVGLSLDALDVVARYEQKSVKRFTYLGKRGAQLRAKRKRLIAAEQQEEKAVAKGRARLLRATRAAAKARREAEKMARIKESPVLPRVGNPESNAISAADGTNDDAPKPIGMTQTGIASMYDDSFTGQMTANGEHYDPNAFTAAHMTLPLGTWVTVTGPGGSVAVRINDRGPYVGGRIIDLSRAAANAVGLPGLGPVTITVSS